MRMAELNRLFFVDVVCINLEKAEPRFDSPIHSCRRQARASNKAARRFGRSRNVKDITRLSRSGHSLDDGSNAVVGRVKVQSL